MAFSPSSHTASNGLQATKHHQSQGVSAYSTFNGSLTNKYHPSQKVVTIATINGSNINKSHHAHGVSATHLQDSTAIRNFEDEEVYASTPVATLHNSPSRLTWAKQVSSGEFIPKEALHLEEEYGGFSVNSDFLIDSINQYTEEVINGGSNTDGPEKGGGTLTHSHLASSKDLRGTGPLASLLDITPVIVGQEERFTDASVAVGHSREIDSCAVTVNPQFTTQESPSRMDKIGASQQDGRVSPFAKVACPSAKTNSPVTVYASTPNISLQGPLAPSVNTQRAQMVLFYNIS
ncbi:hypothetical protein F0562_017935 [Nyssa sinensis]|uniref:Uncharacterized protein n=1 Tax=Nyssa sinensis TaxID=561372 RepID=A0A5J4ZAP8_9ASTE|nr:hypothetical protein F0562_017935 [Nyssa sinensis]